MLQNKNILIGVTAGIAAYKIPLLVRLLVKENAKVKVILTKDAMQFVTPQTLSVLSKNEVIVDFFDEKNNWNNHVQYAEWADLMVVAPLTANTLAKMANGVCDNLLMATYLSTKCPVMIAPAMDLDMYQHATTKENLKKVETIGNKIIPAESGELASGLIGEGRMAEPETIYNAIEKFFEVALPLTGKTAVVNAGPTFEAIDPVRYIGNRSSGKMGICIADRLAELGAKVILILGPTHIKPQQKSVKVIDVNTAEEMFVQTTTEAKQADIVVCSAAVADYKAKHVSDSKIKKDKSELNIELEKTKDILAELGNTKPAKQCLVGFALETDNVEEYAKQKLTQKKLDMIVANSARHAYGVVFGSDSNQVTIIDKNNNLSKFELLSKEDTAKKIISTLMNYIGIKA
ncbi:MAG: bifunctional phosphopantothenoylcysteine decarboxylase/phosphopantothenate--cysteine ligase CoaBC [Bacteroidota bacterium]|nr:bifunctional phosphopantothenoylcysteine decarboxylase/phosphopantothenate--cysteine ligase CoaBC [Bacteroidota bacterium]